MEAEFGGPLGERGGGMMCEEPIAQEICLPIHASEFVW